MAKLSDVDVASRYQGVNTGPRFVYSFETQVGVPVDGTNAELRNKAPFTLRFVPPDALLGAAAAISNGVDLLTSGESTVASRAREVGLIGSASRAGDNNAAAREVRSALNQVSAIGNSMASLESFVASGKFLGNVDSNYYVTLADAYTAADIAIQLKSMLETPPLTLLVGPNSMNISYNNIQTHVSRTRGGLVFERWGEDQATISFSGKTGAFIAGAAKAPGTNTTLSQVTHQTASASGVQFASKRDSAAWQNFMNLFQFYKSNGYIYDTVNRSEAHLMVGAIAIDFDQWTYVGHIESFDYSYSSDSASSITWNMEFRPDRIYDNGQSIGTVSPGANPTRSPNNSDVGSGETLGDVLSDALSTAKDYAVLPFELLR